MRERLSRLLVTGGAGFIGSEFVRFLIKKGMSPVVVDKLTYAGDLKRLFSVKDKVKFFKVDICNTGKLREVFCIAKPEVVVHFAAESHVDRSIRNSSVFLGTNMLGTQNLLDISRKSNVQKFIHISTDEVYGDILKGSFSEESPLKPNSPYAASKAAADLFIKSYIRTYNFPAIIIRPSNNYGPWQYPEKLIPLTVLKVLRNEKVPIYAKGMNVREWLSVEDCARGVWQITQRGKVGEVYNLGSSQERTNIKVIGTLLEILGAGKEMIRFVKDRPGHDLRYSLNCKKVRNKVGWEPRVRLEDGLRKTVEWCLENKKWLLKKWGSIAPLYK